MKKLARMIGFGSSMDEFRRMPRSMNAIPGRIHATADGIHLIHGRDLQLLK
jgi:hypothetical protein